MLNNVHVGMGEVAEVVSLRVATFQSGQNPPIKKPTEVIYSLIVHSNFFFLHTYIYK